MNYGVFFRIFFMSFQNIDGFDWIFVIFFIIRRFDCIGSFYNYIRKEIRFIGSYVKESIVC